MAKNPTAGPEHQPPPYGDRRVEAAAGRGARLRLFEGEERFDILPLLVATDGSLAAFGRDPRRLRPNLVISGGEGLAEREWEGRAIRVGRAVVGLPTCGAAAS